MNTKMIPTEIYSRVVGYFRPVNQWNEGKKEEFNQRKEYDVLKIPNVVDSKETAYL